MEHGTAGRQQKNDQHHEAHGLHARLCEEVDSLDGYLPPHIAKVARKVGAPSSCCTCAARSRVGAQVAGVLEEPQPAPA
ncbi:hypothetical protein ACWEN3_16665 [Streptomyces sp. NPDC004561]